MLVGSGSAPTQSAARKLQTMICAARRKGVPLRKNMVISMRADVSQRAFFCL
jgi:hypothetical protein